jgi:hypothetical protein
MKRVVFTQREAEAVQAACRDLGYRRPAELLDVATDGDERVLWVLRNRWPRYTKAERAWQEISELRSRLREMARGRSDAGEAARARRRIERLETQHPERPTREYHTSVRVDDTVARFLLELAGNHAPRFGRGRPSAAEGLRVLIFWNGGNDADA